MYFSPIDYRMEDKAYGPIDSTKYSKGYPPLL